LLHLSFSHFCRLLDVDSSFTKLKDVTGPSSEIIPCYVCSALTQLSFLIKYTLCMIINHCMYFFQFFELRRSQNAVDFFYSYVDFSPTLSLSFSIIVSNSKEIKSSVPFFSQQMFE
jgi:hypothetical protein